MDIQLILLKIARLLKFAKVEKIHNYLLVTYYGKTLKIEITEVKDESN